MATRRPPSGRVLVDHATSIVNGGRWRAKDVVLWARLVWNGRVFVDDGPSPAGNAGPYLHVPLREVDGSDDSVVCRVYPRRWVEGMRAVRLGGVWHWEYPARPQAPLESTIVRAILDYLRLDGRLLVWRQNTGGASLPGRGGKPRVVRFSEPGAADIQGVVRGSGRFIGLEVKRPGGKPSPAQLAWGAKIREAGAYYAIVTSVDEVRAVLDAIAPPRTRILP